MRTLLLPFFFAVCSTLFSQEQEQEDYTYDSLKEQQLSGPVKSMTLKSFGAVKNAGGQIVKKAPGYQYSWFHDLHITYNLTGGALVAQEMDLSGQIVIERIFSYLNDRLTEVKNGYDTDLFEYDANGNMVMQAKKTEDPEVQGFYAFLKYEYNSRGQLVKTTETDGENTWQGSVVYTYDEKGNLISTKDYYDDSYLTTYFYNAENKLVKMVVKDGEEIIEVTNYTYEGSKRIESWEVYEDGKYNGKVVYTYDNDLEVKTVEYDGQTITETQVTTYEFDSRGNWIKKIIAINGTRFYIEERVIEYYQ